MLRVAVFDDVLAARREVFHIPGLDVVVYEHADDILLVCGVDGAADGDPDGVPHTICMDYAMGHDHASGADAIRALRAAGFEGRIVAMSSDPSANRRMIDAGADEALDKKAMLRSYLVALGKSHLGEE